MGASESCPATPTCKPLLNKHLAYVNDPRSPTAGILRTPIEVESSPQESPMTLLNEEELVTNKQNVSWDPRSPTPGISRTPMKTVMADALNYPVKQLSEVFIAEDMVEKLPLEESHHQDQKLDVACVTEMTPGERMCVEASQVDLLWAEEEKNEQPPACVTAVTKPAPLATALHATGGKSTRRRANSKILTVSTGAGRSPLGTLQDDNSPNSLASHKGKRCLSVANAQGESKEGMFSSGRILKAGSCGWDSLNKENQRHCLLEN